MITVTEMRRESDGDGVNKKREGKHLSLPFSASLHRTPCGHGRGRVGVRACAMRLARGSGMRFSRLKEKWVERPRETPPWSQRPINEVGEPVGWQRVGGGKGVQGSGREVGRKVQRTEEAARGRGWFVSRFKILLPWQISSVHIFDIIIDLECLCPPGIYRWRISVQRNLCPSTQSLSLPDTSVFAKGFEIL